ncbi:unnamed protein product [Paramecium pentaurelia]|uniref:START domain-containing protein n=1 Tax=Paramecium pentaurelia TaxID=43138 RepID=A0A8S1TK93_9CILI|nr:unnamed protein product [Paramecium pentaurelia]
MGNQCVYCLKKFFQRPNLKNMSELPQTDIQQQQEPYTKVDNIDESENYHEHSEEQILAISDNIQETISQSIDIFLYRLKTTKDLEELYHDDQLIILFKSFKLAERYTVIQIQYEFKMKKKSINEFLNYTYLTQIDQFTTLQTTSDYQLIYASFKKIQFVDSREYVFIKYQKQICKNKYIQVLRSINTEQSQQTTRGIIYISGFLLEEIQNQEIRVQAYAEIDFKIRLPPGMLKKALTIELKRALQQFIN